MALWEMLLGEPMSLGHVVVDDVPHVGVATAHEQVLVSFVVLAQLHDLVGDGVERLVPGDRHELGVFVAALFWVGALHGSFDAVRVVDLLQGQVGPGAARRSVDLGALVAVDLYRPAVDDVDLLGAPGRAPLAGRGDPLAHVPTGSLAGLGQRPQIRQSGRSRAPGRPRSPPWPSRSCGGSASDRSRDLKLRFAGVFFSFSISPPS